HRPGDGIDVGGVEVELGDLLEQVVLLHVRQDVEVEAPFVIDPAALPVPGGIVAAPGRVHVAPRRDRAVGVVVVVDGEGELLEVVGAAYAAGRLAHFLDGGDEQADEDGDDGDHHQQLDQRERSRPPANATRNPWHGCDPSPGES